MKSHLIMPMGGAGSRFYKDGYVQPKPLIEIYGKPFFYWASMSILKYIDVIDVTFVVLRKHVDEFQIDKKILSLIPEANIKVLQNILPGPVYTVLVGTDDIKDDAPLIINDCDHMFYSDKLNSLMHNDTLPWDGVLLTFESDLPQYSYVHYNNNNNKIIGAVEKQVVSNHAICGAYIFKNNVIFHSAAQQYLRSISNGEKYMSGIFTSLCNQGGNVSDILLDFHVEFGTPKEYKEALNSRYFQMFV